MPLRPAIGARFAALLCVGLLGACSVAPGPVASVGVAAGYDAEQASAGRQIAVKSCAACHAIDNSTRSPNPAAPPMNTLLGRYNSDRLADDLIAGVRIGHDEMPLFDFDVIAADSLVAYLKSITVSEP